MYFLSIESSTKVFSLALSRDAKVLRFRNLNVDKALEHSIVPAIDKILGSAGISFKKLDAFAVGIGPGSFTSLRVGLATVKAFAMATGKPVVGISSLDVIAQGTAVTPCDEICVLSDARRGMVYAAIYGSTRPSGLLALSKVEGLTTSGPTRPSGLLALSKVEGLTTSGSTRPDQTVGTRSPQAANLKRKSDHMLCGLNIVLDKVHGKTLFVGDGAGLYRDEIIRAYKECDSSCTAVFAARNLWHPKAKVLAKLAFERLAAKDYDDSERLVPLYLYAADCQVTPKVSSPNAFVGDPVIRKICR